MDGLLFSVWRLSVPQVFDVELLQIRNCVRRTTLGGFLSDVVCE